MPVALGHSIKISIEEFLLEYVPGQILFDLREESRGMRVVKSPGRLTQCDLQERGF